MIIKVQKKNDGGIDEGEEAEGDSGTDDLGGDDDNGEDPIVIEEGNLVRIVMRGSETEAKKVSIVVAVDTSGSMAPSITRAMKQLKTIADIFLKDNDSNNMIVVGADSPVANNPAHGTRLNIPSELSAYKNFGHFSEFVGSCNALEAVLKLFKAGGAEGKTIHKDGALHVLILSDDDAGHGNCTESSNRDQDDGIIHDATRYNTEFSGLTTVPKGKTYIHPFIRVSTSNMSICGTSSGTNIGQEYIKLAEATQPKGLITDLCKDDSGWEASFKKVAAELRGSAKSSFTLEIKPAAGSKVTVSVDGVKLPESAYSYDQSKKILEFDDAPADDAKIEISYTRE